MEEIRSDKTLKSDPHLSVPKKSSPSDVKRQIRLPLTNISLDKLPPITDDKVRLPEASPSSPLVKVIFIPKFLSFFCQPKTDTRMFHKRVMQIMWGRIDKPKIYKSKIILLISTISKKNLHNKYNSILSDE